MINTLQTLVYCIENNIKPDNGHEVNKLIIKLIEYHNDKIIKYVESIINDDIIIFDIIIYNNPNNQPIKSLYFTQQIHLKITFSIKDLMKYTFDVRVGFKTKTFTSSMMNINILFNFFDDFRYNDTHKTSDAVLSLIVEKFNGEE